MDGELLSDTFVELTDTMVADFDVIDAFSLLRDFARARNLRLSDPGPGLHRRLRNPGRPDRERRPAATSGRRADTAAYGQRLVTAEQRHA